MMNEEIKINRDWFRRRCKCLCAYEREKAFMDMNWRIRKYGKELQKVTIENREWMNILRSIEFCYITCEEKILDEAFISDGRSRNYVQRNLGIAVLWTRACCGYLEEMTEKSIYRSRTMNNQIAKGGRMRSNVAWRKWLHQQERSLSLELCMRRSYLHSS